MPDLSKPLPVDETVLRGTDTFWTVDSLAALLRAAKDSHTRWEAANGPDLDWPAYYARYIVMRMLLSGTLKAFPKEAAEADPPPDPTEHEGPAAVGGGFFFRGDVY